MPAAAWCWRKGDDDTDDADLIERGEEAVATVADSRSIAMAVGGGARAAMRAAAALLAEETPSAGLGGFS